MRIGCSGQVSHRSGIGVVQKYLYAYLEEAGHDLVFSSPRDVGRSYPDRARGLIRGFRPASGPVDVYLSAVPPLPVGVRSPLLTIVYDLRWQRTRSKIASNYRAWDLRRSIGNSDALICISEKTRNDLCSFEPAAHRKSKSKLLGPGHIPEGSFIDSQSGLLMLVGGAPHKKNEHAAAALVAAKPDWVGGIVGVGVSDRVRETLEESFPCQWFDRISDKEMLELYQRSQYFMMLGTDEGFGLPFVEALATGCQVIATDHPLAREVVGTAGWLLPVGDADTVGEHLKIAPNVPLELRMKHSEKFSWRSFSEDCERSLKEICA